MKTEMESMLQKVEKGNSENERENMEVSREETELREAIGELTDKSEVRREETDQSLQRKRKRTKNNKDDKGELKCVIHVQVFITNYTWIL